LPISQPRADGRAANSKGARTAPFSIYHFPFTIRAPQARGYGSTRARTWGLMRMFIRSRAFVM
jgi:hypothetical protein